MEVIQTFTIYIGNNSFVLTTEEAEELYEKLRSPLKKEGIYPNYPIPCPDTLPFFPTTQPYSPTVTCDSK